MITQDERELLEELRDCGKMIYDKNYTPKQRRILKEMAGKGLVVLAWELLPEGEKACQQQGG